MILLNTDVACHIFRNFKFGADMNLLNNAKWNALSQLFKIGVQLINIVFLAKIIPPAEYGLMAMALVIVNLGNLLRDLGTSSAVIREKVLSNELINTVFWLNVFMGVGLAIVVCICSPLIAMLFHQEKLVWILISISLVFPLSSCANAHLSLLQRESKFKPISFIEISSSSISVIVAIVTALNGFGVYSLVLQSITMNLLSAIMFWRLSEWRPLTNEFIKMVEIRKILKFTMNLSFFNIINFFARNADSFIIGRYMSAAILGAYNLAYRIMLFPLQSLTFVATRSLYPILSHYQNDNAKISKVYLNCIFIVLCLSAPLMSGIAVISEPFVYWIFGQQWYVTADVLKWLAPTSIIQSVLSTTGSVFMAKGRTDVLLKLGVYGTILQVTGFIIGAQYDIDMFVKIYFIANILNFFPVMFYVLKILDTNLNVFFIKIYPIFISVLIMIFSIYIIKSSSNLSIHSNSLIVIFYSTVGFFVYIFSLTILSSEFRSFILKIILRK